MQNVVSGSHKYLMLLVGKLKFNRPATSLALDFLNGNSLSWVDYCKVYQYWVGVYVLPKYSSVSNCYHAEFITFTS